MGKRSGTNWLLVGAIIGVLLIVTGVIELPEFDLPFLTQADQKKDLVDVNKPIDFALTDTYAGSALGTKSLVVYDSDGPHNLNL